MLIETIQKRINEIKQQDRKSYYEIANEIGISESTLYQLMSKGELFTPAEQKIIAYLKGYLTKDEKLEAYRLDNEEIKAENEKLIEGLGIANKYVNKYHKTLQEIKNIAGKPKPFIDFSEIKTATEVEYDYAAICNEFELRLHKVLELITKVEEE